MGEEQSLIGMPACTRQSVEMVTRLIRENNDERGMLIYEYKFQPAVRA